ncbi:flavin reductase family protein [Streptomyces sp. A3M-1-3]|uniref:flavin reductase family protein n=1 Tax=Streptomyces sp. A3M-1-3 TaxID=2962044 RepID=UPI0020B79780|nr:flavin reductase family protein [Streptomyces sp. A3M-1-3]MCP3822716.1 flavin reductase family protein [Streptomyces sp. A3M-1-3]
MDLRATMRNFATGVCVVTTYAQDNEGRRHDALTVNSLTALSSEPPLVSVCLRRGSAFLDDLLATKAWAVSILDVAGDDIAKLLAKSREIRAVALQTLSKSPGEHTGALVLDSLGWMECALRDQRDVGDHTVVIGEVLAAGGQRRRPPLIFLDGTFHAWEDAWPHTALGPGTVERASITDVGARRSERENPTLRRTE